MAAYGSLCTEFYDLDKPTAPPDSLAFYIGAARKAGGRVLEPMCGSGRFLVPMLQRGLPVDGVDSSPAMLKACRAHAGRLGIGVRAYLQEVASLQLPHRYSMVFIPSGSIGLITDDEAFRAALSRIRSHMDPNGRLLLELAADDGTPTGPTELEPRTVMCPDGTSITYSCTVARSAGSDAVRFSGAYVKREGTRVLDAEEEELVLRVYGVDRVMEELSVCGFRKATVSSASDLPFLAGSGCTLVDASAGA